MTDDGPTPAAAPSGPLPEAFLQELSDAFSRYQPVGTLEWNFADAFTRLEREFGVWANYSALIGDVGVEEHPPPAPTGLWPRLRRRLSSRPTDRPDYPTQVELARSHIDSVLGDGRGRVDAGFDAALEALRFLSARVLRLEDAFRRNTSPIADMSELIAPAQLAPWADSVVRWFLTQGITGEVLNGECGDGSLLGALTRAGIACSGVEPRASSARAASEQGVPVELDDVLSALGRRDARSLGGLALAGVIDRVSVGERIELLASSVRALIPGAPVVVLGDGASATTTVAHDLLPGRGFQPETWELLLERAGFHGIERLGSPVAPGAGVAAYAIGARAPR